MLSGVSRRFGSIVALSNIDLVVPAGAITVLLGPNGAGKTTLLRTSAGRSRPTAGRVLVCGLDAYAQPSEARARVGFVGHQPALYRDFDAHENLRFFARLHGVADVTDRIATVIDEVGLTRLDRRPCGELSRGQAQRLSIARALLHEPPVLLLDEPFSGLDPAAASALEELLRRLAAAGRTVVVSSHDLRRAAALATAIALLHRGLLREVLRGSAVDEATLREHFEAATVADSSHVVRSRGVAGSAAAGRADGGATWAPDGPSTPTLAATLPSAIGVAAAVAAKDLRLEWRAKEVVPPALVFAAVAMVILGRSFVGSGSEVARLAPGALWVALLLGSTLGLSRTMAAEAEQGVLDAVLGSPADRSALFIGKWLGAWLFTTLVGLLLLPFTVAVFGLRVALPGMLTVTGVLVLGAAGWAAAGVLVAAAAVGARGREILLPVLLYPLALPLVLPAAQLTAAAFADDGAMTPALALVGAYALIYMVLGALLFPFAVEN